MESQNHTGVLPLTVRPSGKRVEAGRFRELMSSFPTGVSVVTATDGEGRPWGATCSSLASVALSPPTLLVCLRKHGGTIEAIQSSRRFAVNLLHASAREAAMVFSSPGADRFAEVSWESWHSGLPYLYHDAFAVAACEVAGQVQVGDHTIVIGGVSDIRTSAGVPLLYGLRRYSSWPLPVIPTQVTDATPNTEDA